MPEMQGGQVNYDDDVPPDYVPDWIEWQEQQFFEDADRLYDEERLTELIQEEDRGT